MIINNAQWLDPDTAPKDGTTVLLLVQFDENSLVDTDDSKEWKVVTIGHNNNDHSGEDCWYFAGWDWNNDRYIEGYGDVVGWFPFSHPEHPDIAE